MEAPDAYELEIFRRLGQTLDDEELELSRLIATVKKNVKELSLSDEAKVAVKEHLEPYVQWERHWRHAELSEAADVNRLYIEVFNRVLMSTFFSRRRGDRILQPASARVAFGDEECQRSGTIVSDRSIRNRIDDLAGTVRLF